jgi:putative heme transporter
LARPPRTRFREGGSVLADSSAPANTSPRPAGRKRAVRIIQAAISLAVVVVIFALILPKIASYGSVWHTVTQLTWLELLTLVAATVFNLFTYWWQMQAAMPGLTLAQAAVNNQTGTTISNIVPGGGAISLGVVIAMFRSWGFSGSDIALLISTTGVWNSFMKLGLPVIALGLLAVTGQATAALIAPALIGLVILAGAVVLFALMLWRKRFARAIGNGLGRTWSRVRRIGRRPPVTTWGEGAVRFRKDTIRLVERRWLPLTVTTVISHLALYLVLLLALRHVGVSEKEVSAVQVLAVFAFARLVSAAPITPGGVGFVELALIGGLYAAGRSHTDVSLSEFKAQITAATLLFRTLTYGIQIPLGGFTYIVWRRRRAWLKAPRPQPEPEPAAAVQPV